MLGMLSTAIAGMNTFDMAMLGVNAIGAVTGLLGLGNKSQYKTQKNIAKAKMKQLEAQKEIAKMTTKYNVKNAKESYYTNFGRLNSDYAGTRFELNNQITDIYDNFVGFLGSDTGIQKGEILQRKQNYLEAEAKSNLIKINDSQKQDLQALSKENIQTLLGYGQDYYNQLTGVQNAELDVIAAQANAKNQLKANQLGSIQSMLGSVMNMGQIASKAYEKERLYGTMNNVPTFESNFTGLKLEKFGL